MSERIWGALRKNALYKSTYTLLTNVVALLSWEWVVVTVAAFLSSVDLTEACVCICLFVQGPANVYSWTVASSLSKMSYASRVSHPSVNYCWWNGGLNTSSTAMPTRRSQHSLECKHPRRLNRDRDVNLWPFDPKINGFPVLMVEHFCV